MCEKLWPAFVAPILDKEGGKKPGDYWPREFSKLIVKNRALFQSEAALIDSIVPIPLHESGNPVRVAPPPPPIKLPYYAAFLLIAAYLASHNPPRSDIPMLSKSAPGRKRKNKGAAAATPRHSKNALKAHRKISRKLLGPQVFGLERLFAIFHAVMFEERYKGGSAELMGQFATLVRLRLVVQAGAVYGGMGDALEGGGRWRCAVGWDLVQGVARAVSFVLEDYVVE